MNYIEKWSVFVEKIRIYAIVSVNEGALLLPYVDVLVENGYEQFNLDNSRLAEKKKYPI